jgi:hypothetical protein
MHKNMNSRTIVVCVVSVILIRINSVKFISAWFPSQTLVLYRFHYWADPGTVDRVHSCTMLQLQVNFHYWKMTVK